MFQIQTNPPAGSIRRPALARRGRVEQLESRSLLTANVVINEIHYDPPDKTQFAEFIELYNNSDVGVDLSGWTFSNAIDYQLPEGTSLLPHGFLIVAQDPSTADALFGQSAVGPWQGQLRNSGERIDLYDADGNLVDRVDYGRSFPWPTVGDAPGHSIELIHPELDNDLGGNWRRAGGEDSGPQVLVHAGSTWNYLPGEQEPAGADGQWRLADYDDSAWSSGAAPIGYGDAHVRTRLQMRNNFSTVYLRQVVDVASAGHLGRLALRAQYDDGFHLWINGHRVLSANVSARNTAHTATARTALENLDYLEFEIPEGGDYLVDGENVIAVQLINASLGNSSDAWFDAELVLTGDTGNYSPDNRNTVWSENAPPAARQVDHGTGEKGSDVDVPVTVKVTDADGVGAVTLEYQVVEPGDYFGRYLRASLNGTPVLDPRYDDPVEWTTVVMNDGGHRGDSKRGDDVYTGIIPAAAHRHRNLVRYRIATTDTLGASAQVPYADDMRHNFAYFVYDGFPSWTASSRPGHASEVTFDLEGLPPIATYHLLTTEEYHEDSQSIPNGSKAGYGGSEYLWPGTIVYDGEVYDHIRYRARGGVWRYAMGKNMWKFDFNRGNGFQARDDYGQPYREAWDKLNFSAVIQQGNYLHRGEQGLFESVGFKLFNLAGVESPYTHFVHFRIIDSEDEHGSSQYSGDFRGLYLAIEQPDGNLLDEHDLPDGNLYKIENYLAESNNQGATQVSDGSDVADFISAYRSRQPSPDWWESHLDLDRYYSYRTIVEGIHHYDIAYGKNYFYYHNPDTDRFQVVPWDLDLTWANNMYGSGQHDFVTKVANNPAFRTAYQNRLRELRDLLFNEEQTGLLIDEMAGRVYTPGEPSWVDADREMWDYNPILRSSYVNPNKAGTGRFYEQSATGDFAGMAQLMKDYVAKQGRRLDRLSGSDRNIPVTPKVKYIGEHGFPINGLTFESSEFSAPNGDDSFAAMEWRLAEITDPLKPLQRDQRPKYEITSNYESGLLGSFTQDWTIPGNKLMEGGLYRVRVRMQDVDGHWSHWSSPVQFTAGPAVPTPVAASLRISEVHYHPAAPTAMERAAGFLDADEFEFVELLNTGQQAVSLDSTALVRLDEDGEKVGVDFAFAKGSTAELRPGQRVLVVENMDAFAFRYGTHHRVAGQWSGKLGNGGERIRLVDNGAIVMDFVYDDSWHPATDGDGRSLELVDPGLADSNSWNQASSWIPSERQGGSPGASRVRGDLNSDLRVDIEDVELIYAALARQDQESRFDLNEDQRVGPADATYLVETLLSTVPGDADLDRRVDFRDFLVISASFGRVDAAWRDGDFDGDQHVSFTDFLRLSAHYGVVFNTDDRAEG